MAERRVITLLTDFGEGSYVPSVKAVLLGLAPDARLIDITHGVPPGAIGSAAYILSHTAPFFPQGTTHLAVVDPMVGTSRLALVVEAVGSYFVGPDNGIFAEVIERSGSARAFQIEEGPWMPSRVSPTFHGRDLFAHVAGRLARGEPPGSFGSPIDLDRIVPSTIPSPEYEELRCAGEVVWIDRFGNLITNLQKRAVEEWAQDLPYRAMVGGTWIDTRVHTFHEGATGSLVVLFGSWDTVEVAVSGGSAASRLGVCVGEPVLLEKIHAR